MRPLNVLIRRGSWVQIPPSAPKTLLNSANFKNNKFFIKIKGLIYLKAFRNRICSTRAVARRVLPSGYLALFQVPAFHPALARRKLLIDRFGFGLGLVGLLTRMRRLLLGLPRLRQLGWRLPVFSFVASFFHLLS